MSAGYTVDSFKYNPFVPIGFSLPTGTRNAYLGSSGIEDNWHKENFTRGQAVPTTGPLMSQEFDIRAFIFPNTYRLFDNDLQFFIFRTTNRNNHADGTAFVADWHQWVHPTNWVVGSNLIGHRHYCGSHNNADLDRVSEFAVNPDFYGGRADDPNGSVIKFQPLAWYSQPKVIQDNGVMFPQPFNNDLATGVKPFAGIDFHRISDGSSTYYFKYGPDKLKYGQAKQTFLYGIGLVMANPEYDGGSQIAKYIVISPICPFTVGFKKHNFKDTDGVLKPFATDWNFKKGTPGFKM